MKTLNSTNSHFMQQYFVRKIFKYDLRTRYRLKIPAARSFTFGIDPIKFQCSLLYNLVPDFITRASSAAILEKNVRNWNGEECNCKIYR